MGRTGHPVLILGTTALLVVAVGTSVALTRDTQPIAKAATTVTQVANASIISADGTATIAHIGQRVPNGAVVRTGPDGSAQLKTRGRVVYLEGSVSLAVVDGAHQQLRHGTAVVDAQHGPGLRLDLADDALAIQAGSATEATRSVSATVGSLAGPAELTSATGRHLDVPALAQAVVSGDSLPATTTPLHLTDQAAEAHVVPTMVNDDVALQTLANGINASGQSTARVIETAWTGTTTPLPAGAPRSDQVLPMVIADATSSAGGTTQDRYNQVTGWRSQGGSWGVVVALLKTHSGAVETKFQALQLTAPTAPGGTPVISALGAPGRFGVGQPHHRNGNHPTSHPTTPTPTPSHPGGNPGGGTTPTPQPSPGLVGSLVGTVGGTLSSVLGTVLDLLPKHVAATPKPHATPTSPGLLGALLGGH